MVDKFNQDLDDDLLEYLVADVIEITLDQYTVKKLPKTGMLSDCLEVYTKERLLKLAEENGLEAKQNWKKDRIINHLYDSIMDRIEERFLLLGERKLELLQQFSNGEFGADEMTLDEAEFYMTVYPIAVRMGLLYSFNGEEAVSTTLPFEAKQSLDDVLSNFNQVRKQYHSEIVLWEQIEEILEAGVHLYGALTTGDVMDLWEIRHADPERTTEQTFAFLRYLFEKLPLLVIKNGYYFIKKYVIASTQFVDGEEVENFYYYRSNKMNGDYYEPTKQEIKYYAQHSFDRETLVYKRLKQFIEKITGDTEMVMELIESSILMGDELSNLMDEIAMLELIQFDTEKQVEKFVELYVPLHNNSRLWENGGYTPTEMVAQATDGLDIPQGFNPFDLSQDDQEQDNIIPLASYQENKNEKQQPKRVDKVGRNDPCPCGSGKKHKKCCMNKQ